jgi:hypothetical protein
MNRQSRLNRQRRRLTRRAIVVAPASSGVSPPFAFDRPGSWSWSWLQHDVSRRLARAAGHVWSNGTREQMEALVASAPTVLLWESGSVEALQELTERLPRPLTVYVEKDGLPPFITTASGHITPSGLHLVFGPEPPRTNF